MEAPLRGRQRKETWLWWAKSSKYEQEVGGSSLLISTNWLMMSYQISTNQSVLWNLEEFFVSTVTRKWGCLSDLKSHVWVIHRPRLLTLLTCHTSTYLCHSHSFPSLSYLGSFWGEVICCWWRQVWKLKTIAVTTVLNIMSWCRCATREC